MFSTNVARRLARLAPALAAGAALCAILAASAAAAQDLSLSEALWRVAGGDPVIAANAARLEAAEAGILQADVRPRDVITLGIEDFAGTGPYAPPRRSETTAWLDRTWERGGKREARIGAARSQIDVAAGRNRLRVLDLLEEVQIAFAEAQAAAAAIPIAEQRLADAQRVETEVDRRVGRALDPLFAAERASTAVAQARIALDQAREAARIARATLAAFWAGSEDYTLQTAPFATIDPAAAEAGISAAPPDEARPDLALLGAERDAASARLRLAQSGDAADPTGRIGLRHLGEGNDMVLVIGGSIPLGVRAANRGNVTRAQAEAQAAEADIAAARLRVEREIGRISAQRAAILAEVLRIDREVLPGAERAVAMVREGFARGGTAFTFLEVSQAHQAVIDARSRKVQLLLGYHLAGARLDRLTGRHLPLLARAEIR